ncbi:fibronectin type III domain protein, partial [Candidatus Magnetomorum sp. HK-1]
MGQKATVKLENGKALVELSVPETAGLYTIDAAFSEYSSLHVRYDHDQTDTTEPIVTTQLDISVIPAEPSAIWITAARHVNGILGDPNRLEIGENLIIQLMIVDQYGNRVSQWIDPNGSWQDATMNVMITLTGHASCNGLTGTIPVSIDRGLGQLTITDNSIESVGISITSIDSIPHNLSYENGLTVQFLKPLPAIAEVTFSVRLDNIHPNMIFSFTE